MQDFNDAQDAEENKNDFEIDIDSDYLLNEGTQILSDYMIINQNFYLSKAS